MLFWPTMTSYVPESHRIIMMIFAALLLNRFKNVVVYMELFVKQLTSIPDMLIDCGSSSVAYRTFILLHL